MLSGNSSEIRFLQRFLYLEMAFATMLATKNYGLVADCCFKKVSYLFVARSSDILVT